MKERIPCSQVKLPNKMNMNYQNSMSPMKPTHPIEVFSNDNCLEEKQYTQLKGTIINCHKIKKWKNNINKHFIKLQEDDNKCLSDSQENTNTNLNEIIKIIPHLEAEFNKRKETLKLI